MSSTSTANIERVAFISLGCPRTVDSSKCWARFARPTSPSLSSMIRPTPSWSIPAVLESSKRNLCKLFVKPSPGVIIGEAKRVVVAGCLVQRHRAKILDWVQASTLWLGSLIVTESWMRSAGWIVSPFPWRRRPSLLDQR